MKSKILLPTLMFLLMSMQIVLAIPVIQNVTVDPSSLWLGESTTVSLDCSDSNNTITYVYADIVGPSIILPRMFFVPSGGKYVLLVDQIYLDRTGLFDATLTCENNIDETTVDSTSFTVSELTGYINDISPSPAYIGDIINIDFVVKKDDVEVSSGVTFDVKFNGLTKSLLVDPAYDSIRGWILKLDAPTVPDEYDIDIIASYDRTGVEDSGSIDVHDYIEFEIISVNKDWFDVEEEIIVKVKALQGGSLINVNEGNIEIKIGSTSTEIKSVTYNAGNYDVKIVAPHLSSGTYQLESILTHESISYSDSKEISYVVSISGEIVDESDRGLSVKISFIRDGVTDLTFITDAFGRYDTSLPPGTYDIEILFPNSKLYIYSAIINSFNDPIKYYYAPGVAVPGVRNAGLHDFGIGLVYSSVDIEMDYIEKSVQDETDLKVFRCSKWNSGKKICNGDWLQVNGNVDPVRNIVEVTSDDLSAFVIGTIEGLKVDFNLDKKVYNFEDSIIVRGIVKDLVGKIVGHADISVDIEGTDIGGTTTADANGVLSMSLPVPENEGNYTVSLSAGLYPYTDFDGEESFILSKSKLIYVNFPDTVKMGRGEDFRQSFSLINTGEADLYDITLSLEGLSEDYYTLITNVNELQVGEEKSVYIDFSIPSHAETGISSVILKVSSDDLYQDKVFGFNINEESQEGEEVPSPTGFVTTLPFPEINLNTVYMVLLGAIGIIVIFILRKKLTVRRKKYKPTSFLSDVKDQLKEIEIGFKERVDKKHYDDLIASEFPDALKNIEEGDN